MEFNELVDRRQSVRSFQDKAVDEHDIRHILEAANKAPSAGNLQAYTVYVVKNQDMRESLSNAAYEQDSLKEAPVCIVFCARPSISGEKYGERGKALYAVQDATIATAYAQLGAADKGLGSVWVGAFDEEEVRKILHISEEDIPVSILPIGYPNEHPQKKEKKPFSELVHIL